MVKLRGLVAVLALLAVLPVLSAASAWNPAASLREHLEAAYPWDEIEVGSFKAYTPLPSGPPKDITVIKGPPGKTVFRLKYSGGREITASASVKALDRVVLSGRPFEKGHNLQSDDLYVSLMDIRRIPRGAISSTEEAVGKVLNRSVPVNKPIQGRMLSESGRLKRGHRITLVISHGGLNITMSGVLRRDARVGEQVEALNTSTRKAVIGLLVDENTVIVSIK